MNLPLCYSRALVASGVLFLALCFAPALLAGDLEDLRAADLRRVTALINADRPALEAVLSDDLTYGHADGRVQTKTELLAAVASGTVTHHSYDGPPPVVRVQGEIGLLAGVADLQVSARGTRAQLSLRYLAVYAKNGGSWRLIAYQSTRVEPAR